METPILAIDVDGILSPLIWTKQGKQLLKKRGFRSIARQREFRCENPAWHPYSELWLARAHGEMLAKFSAAEDVELVWASLWAGNCNRIIGQSIGLPRLPHIDFHNHWSGSSLWKWDAVAEFAAGRPLAWLDDGFVSRDKQRKRRASGFNASRRNLPTLLQEVDPRVGLQAPDLNAVRSWLRTMKLAW